MAINDESRVINNHLRNIIIVIDFDTFYTPGLILIPETERTINTEALACNLSEKST